MAQKGQAQTIRIIGGQHRGRKLTFTEQKGLRPTGDRVKETLFNWLQAYIRGANVLDMYAGSGSLGFEAQSRGAATVTMLELTALQTRQLKVLSGQLQADNISIHQADALKWSESYQGSPFDLVFLDPPFADNLLQQSVDKLAESGLVKTDSMIYLEADKKQSMPEIPPDWEVMKEKKMGQVNVWLLRVGD